MLQHFLPLFLEVCTNTYAGGTVEGASGMELTTRLEQLQDLGVLQGSEQPV